MSRNTRSDHKGAQLRRTAVKLYRTGIPVAEVARQLHRSGKKGLGLATLPISSHAWCPIRCSVKIDDSM
jgi:hypothetical protein